MNTKRMVALLCSLLMVFGILTGCGGRNDPSNASSVSSSASGASAGSSEPAPSKAGNYASGISAPVKLTMVDMFLPTMTEANYVALNIMIDEFSKKYPEITITRDQIAGDLIDTKVPTLAAANELPDLFACRAAWISNFATANQIKTMGEVYAGDSFLEGFGDGMLNDFTYKGEVYAIPWRAVSNFFMYYNMDILGKAGITKHPKTYEELLAAAKAVKAAGYIPFGLGDKSKWCSRMWFSGLAVRTAGPDYLERLKSGELKFTDEPILKAMNVINDIARMEGFNPDFASVGNDQARQLYLNKTFAMYGDMNQFAQMQKTDFPEDVSKATEMDFFPALPGEGGIDGKVAAPVSCGWGMAFNAGLKDDKLLAAKFFVKEIEGDTYNKRLAELGGATVRPVPDADLSSLSPLVVQYNTNIAPRIMGGGHIDNRLPGAVLDVVTASLQEMILGLKTPKEALQAMQDSLDKSRSLF